MHNRLIYVVLTLSILIYVSSCSYFDPELEELRTNQSELSKEAKNEERKKIVDGYKFIADASDGLNSRGLLIIAATIGMIVGTSHLRPRRRWSRGIYLLFIPGWLFIAVSAFFSFRITRGYAGLPLGRFDSLGDAQNLIHSNLWWQMFFFQLGFAFFAFWLIGFLLLWIFDDEFSSKNTR